MYFRSRSEGLAEKDEIEKLDRRRGILKLMRAAEKNSGTLKLLSKCGLRICLFGSVTLLESGAPQGLQHLSLPSTKHTGVSC